MLKRPREGKGKGKLYQSSKHKKSGKYLKQYTRTVKRLGRWRGKRVDWFSRLIRKLLLNRSYEPTY